MVSIGNYAFAQCTGLGTLSIPDSVAVIGDYAFYQCSSLTSVTYGKGVRFITNNAFAGCALLTEVVLPPLVERVYDSAFYGCRGLTTVVIPAGVTMVDNDAFNDTPLLKDVYFLGDAPAFGYAAFRTWLDPYNPADPYGLLRFVVHFYPHVCGFTLGSWTRGESETYNTVYNLGYDGAFLSPSSVVRTTATTASVTFASNKPGWFYSEVVEDGAAAPAVPASGLGLPCTSGPNTFTLTSLTAGAKDVYVRVKDGAGSASSILKMDVPAAGTWTSWRAGEAVYAGGWRGLYWLGYYNLSYDPWVYHLEHGWLYPYDEPGGGVYFWDVNMSNFWWTKGDFYPWLYRFGTGASWLWYAKGSSAPRWFYNVTTSSWESMP